MTHAASALTRAPRRNARARVDSVAPLARIRVASRTNVPNAARVAASATASASASPSASAASSRVARVAPPSSERAASEHRFMADVDAPSRAARARYTYVDLAGATQGPFAATALARWRRDGFLERDLPLRDFDDGGVTTVGDVADAVDAVERKRDDDDDDDARRADDATRNARGDADDDDDDARDGADDDARASALDDRLSRLLAIGGGALPRARPATADDARDGRGGGETTGGADEATRGDDAERARRVPTAEGVAGHPARDAGAGAARTGGDGGTDGRGRRDEGVERGGERRGAGSAAGR